jgi:biopolymer transport protein ExbD
MKLPLKAHCGPVNLSIRMTPLIDVIFLLLIFFIMTMQFQKPEGVLANRLPEKSGLAAEQPQDREIVRLRIRLVIAGGDMPSIFLQDREVRSYEDLHGFLTMLPEDVLLVVEPEARVPYRHVVGVYNTCIKAGKHTIVFSMARPGSPAPAPGHTED